jgi:hypothetical protein
MSRNEIILAVVAVAMVALVLLARRSGPRVTTIETRREEESQ